MTELADDALRAGLWAAWTDDQTKARRNIPWKAFLTAGLADNQLIDWAIATMPASPRPRAVTADRLPTTGDGGGVALQFFNPEDSPQALALDHLVTTGGPATVKALLRAPHEWAAKALHRMKLEHPDAFRRLCINAALASDDHSRIGQLQAFSPRRGESDLWESVASAASTWGERAVRWCQVSVAHDEGDSRWSEARMALQLLECVVAGPGKGEARFIEVFGRGQTHEGENVAAAGDDGGKDPVQDPRTLFREIHQELSADVDSLLAGIGSVLGLAWKQGESGLDELVKAVFASEHLRPRILGGFHHPWWVMAWELLGKDYVIGKLVDGHEDRPNGEATDWRLDGMTSAMMFDQAVLPLARHELLGDAAVAVIARRIVGTRPDLMETALMDRPLGVGAEPNAASLALARRLPQAAPDDLVSWLARRLSGAAPALRLAWWAAVVPSLPMGDAREKGVAEWLEAVASVSAPRRPRPRAER